MWKGTRLCHKPGQALEKDTGKQAHFIPTWASMPQGYLPQHLPHCSLITAL